MITARGLVELLGWPSDDPAVKSVLVELGLPETPPELEDGVSSNLETDKGVAIFFRAARYLRHHEQLKGYADERPIVSEILLKGQGPQCEPPVPGALPHDLSFQDSREKVIGQFGPPVWTSLLGGIDRFNVGQRYVTIAFGENDVGFLTVCIGLLWEV